MKFSFNKFFSYGIVAVSILTVTYYFIDQNQLLSSILSIKPGEFFLLVLFVFLSLVLNGLKILWLQKVFGLNLSLNESVSLASVNAMWNYLPFTGGLVVRGAYLKKRHRFPWAKFIAVVVASYFISMITFGAVGLLVTLLLINTGKIIFSLVFIALILVPLAFLSTHNLLKKLNFKYVHYLLKVTIGLGLLAKNKLIFLSLIILDFLLIFIDSSRLYLASQFSGAGISFPTALLITPLTILASLVNITPGALVIREALITLTTTQLNYSIEAGVIVSTVDRAALVVGIFIGGIIGSIYLARKISEN